MSDVFTIEWGLRKLVFRECDLDDQACFLFMHHSALFMMELDTQADSTRPVDTRFVVLSILGIESAVEGTCVSLSWGLCRQGAFTNVYSYLRLTFRQSKSIQFLDLSQNNLDKKSVEHIVAALATAPDPGLISLRLDDCALRPASLETLGEPFLGIIIPLI